MKKIKLLNKRENKMKSKRQMSISHEDILSYIHSFISTSPIPSSTLLLLQTPTATQRFSASNSSTFVDAFECTRVYVSVLRTDKANRMQFNIYREFVTVYILAAAFVFFGKKLWQFTFNLSSIPLTNSEFYYSTFFLL